MMLLATEVSSLDHQNDLIKFISPFVETSWLFTVQLFFNSGSIAFANCLPSSTLEQKVISIMLFKLYS